MVFIEIVGIFDFVLRYISGSGAERYMLSSGEEVLSTNNPHDVLFKFNNLDHQIDARLAADELRQAIKLCIDILSRFEDQNHPVIQDLKDAYLKFKVVSSV